MTLLLTGFILGLTANLHCLGMCGPIAMAIPVNRSTNLSMLSGSLQYNLGRVFTYAVLGLVVGAVGLSIHTIGILQWLSIATGIGLIFYAWRKYFGRLVFGRMPSLKINALLNARLGKVIRSNSPFRLLSLGALNGLLPCGMVFAALLNAILTGDIWMSAAAMIAFGVGTLPAMIAVTFMANKITGESRKKLSRAVPYLLTIIGVMIVLRGMNLDIPYLSPKVSTVQEHCASTTDEHVEMSCCHKPE